MNKLLLIYLCVFCNLNFCFAQNKKINEVAFSSTFIWNNTTIFNSFSGARGKDITGNALSNGFNINYSKSIYKNFYGKIGIGYFNQKFGIKRPFDFKETVIDTKLLYSTKNYSYKNINYFIGVGYQKAISKKIDLHTSLTYNFYNTYKQVYKTSGEKINSLGNSNKQIENQKYYQGENLIFQLGASKQIYKNYKIGVDVLMPFKDKWRKDEIFREDSNEFYGSNFSIGTSINLVYSFNKK